MNSIHDESQATRAAINAPLVRPLRYRLHERFGDWYGGRRGGKFGEAHRVTTDDRQPSATHRRLAASCAERCEREHLAQTRIAAPQVDRRNQTANAIDAIDLQILDLQRRLDATPAPTAEQLAVRHASETHLSDQQVHDRRLREALAEPERLRTQLVALHTQRDQLVHMVAAVDGALQTLWLGLCRRVDAIADYYERRAETVSRAYLRRARPAPDDMAEHPLNTRRPIIAPDWARQPNPWTGAAIPVPDGQEAQLRALRPIG